MLYAMKTEGGIPMKMSTKMLVEAGILIALAQILSYIKVYEAPFGGSVTAGSMVPIIIYALRWGTGPGLLAGTVYGLLQFGLGQTYSLNIWSILLDYIVAFGLLGLAGLAGKTFVGNMIGTLTGIFARFVSHVIAGVTIWVAYAPEGTNPWVYSIAYNGSYLLPEFIISIIIIMLLRKPLKRIG
jgi:thiamine transporter